MAERITASHANLIARLPQESQAEAFEQCWRKDWQDSEPHLLPAKHVSAWIQNNLYLALADAPFDREEPTLNPAAGACVTCPRHSGYNTSLFSDVTDGDQCLSPFTPTYFQTFEEYEAKKRAIPDPTSLIVIDEADRLSMPSLEQLRSVFDQTGFGMVLIGMPGPGSRSEPHATRSSSRGSASCTNSGRSRLRRCRPFLRRTGTALASGSLAEAPAPDVVAAIIRVTGGNFRLITRLLTQMERVFKINQLKHLSPRSGRDRTREPGHRSGLNV